MDIYTYKELSKKVNTYFKDGLAAHVTERTLRFWVKEGILPKPIGAGKWRYFEENHFQEIISIRKLQSSYGQNIEDIKKINDLANTHLNSSDSKTEKKGHFNLSKIVFALENFEKLGINPVPELESFKRQKRILIKDTSYSVPYLLVDKNKSTGAYVEEGGVVYRILDTLPVMELGSGHFTIEGIEAYLYLENEEAKSIHSKKHDIKADAKEIRNLIAEGIINTPRYRFKGKSYFSASDLSTYNVWKSFRTNYGLSKGELKLLKERIEFDIENFFYIPEPVIVSIESSLFYKFQKQSALLKDCLYAIAFYLLGCETLVANHTMEDNKKILRDYIDGFLFLCNDFSGNACLKKTPIERLSAKQIKSGLSQGRFIKKEFERVLKAKEVEVKTFKAILKQMSKGGGKRGNHD